MMIFLYILSGWLIYWISGLSWLVYMVRKDQDISVSDFIEMAVATAVFGPFMPLLEWLRQASADGAFEKVLIKKCKKRAVWKALGGNPRNAP